MGKFKFKLKNLDLQEKKDLQTDNGFILDTGVNYLKIHKVDMLFQNSIYSRKFGISDSDPEEVITYLYTCECEELTGQINEGKICERCETKVTKNDFPVTKRAWGVIKPYSVMTYAAMVHLQNLIGRAKFDKFLKGKLKNINMMTLKEDFEYFLDEYGKPDKEEVKEFLLEHKEEVFTSYIPVLSKKLRPVLRSHNIIPHFTMLDDMNSYYTSISQDIQTLKDYCDDDITPSITESTLSSIQKKIYKLGVRIEDIVGGGKEKILRNDIYATRLPYTGRAVIVPLVTDRIGVCTLPYDSFRGIFRNEILDILIENGEPIHKAYEFIELNRMLDEKDKKILDNILEHELENPYVLVNRQPTLKFQSTKSLEIISLEDEDVMRLPSALLEGYNGDHRDWCHDKTYGGFVMRILLIAGTP